MGGNENFQDDEKYRRLPAFALQIISFLDLYITKEMNVFEWGSGGSTLFFASRAKQTTSIEHLKEWHKVTADALAYSGINGKCDLRFVSRDLLKSLDSDSFKSSQATLKHVSFKNYVTAIDEFEDSFFDVVLVDGRARAACIKRAIPKIKPGGLLVVDDAGRDAYQHALKLPDWHRSDAFGPIPYMSLTQLARTAVLVKP